MATGRALFWTFSDFDAEADHEISLQKGDVVEVDQSLENGWWKGKVLGFAAFETSSPLESKGEGETQAGWFPSTFLRPWKPPTDRPSHPVPPLSQQPLQQLPDLLNASPRTLAASLITMNEADSEKVLKQLSDQRRSDVMRGIDLLASEHGLATPSRTSDEPSHAITGQGPAALPVPSKEDISMLVAEGFDEEQAAVVSIVDSLMQQGASREEAQQRVLQNLSLLREAGYSREVVGMLPPSMDPTTHRRDLPGGGGWGVVPIPSIRELPPQSLTVFHRLRRETDSRDLELLQREREAAEREERERLDAMQYGATPPLPPRAKDATDLLGELLPQGPAELEVYLPAGENVVDGDWLQKHGGSARGGDDAEGLDDDDRIEEEEGEEAGAGGGGGKSKSVGFGSHVEEYRYRVRRDSVESVEGAALAAFAQMRAPDQPVAATKKPIQFEEVPDRSFTDDEFLAMTPAEQANALEAMPEEAHEPLMQLLNPAERLMIIQELHLLATQLESHSEAVKVQAERITEQRRKHERRRHERKQSIIEEAPEIEQRKKRWLAASQPSVKFSFKNVRSVDDVAQPVVPLPSPRSRGGAALGGSAIEELFRRFDANGDGTIDYEEFLEACTLLGLSFPEQELEMLFTQSDEDMNGVLELHEFKELMSTLRWRRQELVSSGQWKDDADVKLLGDVDMDKFMEWVHSVVDDGLVSDVAKSSKSFKNKNRSQRQVVDLRKNLRDIFSRLDIDDNGNVDIEALRRAMLAVGVDLPEDALREMIAEVDHTDSGELDFDQFERTFAETYFNVNGMGKGTHAGHWKSQLRRNLDSRVRAPPPLRPSVEQDGLFPVGSVKGPDEATRTDLQFQQVGKLTLQNSIVSPLEEVSMVTIKVECANLPSLASKIKNKHKFPSHPCRPVAVLNFREPRNQTWFEVGHSDWVGAIPKPFQISTTLEYFERLPALEVCLYDLENGEGTAKIKISTMFIPNRSLDVQKAVTARRRRGSLVGTEVGGELAVKIEEAWQLPKMDALGLSDPYANIKIGEQKHRTRTEKATLNPKWQQEFAFAVDWNHNKLIVDVFDWDAGVAQDDYIGSTVVNISDLCATSKHNQWQTRWYHLRNKDGQFVWGNQVVSLENEIKKGFFATLLKKAKTINVKDARNYTASPEYSLGSIEVSRADMRRALELGKSMAMKKKIASEDLQKHLQHLFSGYSARDMFYAWMEAVEREKNLMYFELANHPDKYAALDVEAQEQSGGGDAKLTITLGATDLPNKNRFGHVYPYLAIEAQVGTEAHTDAPLFERSRRTQHVPKTTEPVWETIHTTVADLVHGDINRRLRLRVFDYYLGNNEDELLGYCYTNIHELESLSRSKSFLHLKDPEDEEKPAGKIQCLDVRHWILSVYSTWTYTLHVEVFSRVPGDALSVADTAAGRRRASMQMDVDKVVHHHKQTNRRMSREHIQTVAKQAHDERRLL